MIYQEHAHRKLRQAFDAILQQFSSNGSRKSMLSANRSFQAQNSTCSTLLQTMLLYETCIVLSRKCLWDVNKDFWHQWRSLVTTTLSARAIYRQIPVSYLQTWYIFYSVFLRCNMSHVAVDMIVSLLFYISFLALLCICRIYNMYCMYQSNKNCMNFF